MAQDFRSFLQQLEAGLRSGGSALPPVQPPDSRAAAPPPPPAPMPTPTPQPPPAPRQAAPLPQYGAQQGQFAQALSPSQFAAAQNFMQGPERQGQEEPPAPAPSGEPDLSGTWVTVQWNYNGTQYNLLVPEEHTKNLPSDANVIPNGTITNEPERVEIAMRAGERGQMGQTFTGLLQQAPPEIQAVFSSSGEEIDRQRNATPAPTETPWPDFPVAPETTQAPVNEEGQTAREVMEGAASAAGAATVRTGGELPEQAGFTDEQGQRVPPLTTDKLRETDPVKAAALEEAGIYDIPVDQMAVRDRTGQISLMGVNDEVPDGVEIITYGGDTPDPEGRDASIGGIISQAPGAIGAVMDALEVPQRKAQGLVSSTFGEGEMNPVGEAIVGGFNWLDDLAANIPGVGTLQDIRDTGVNVVAENPVSGYIGFGIWLVQNPEIAADARENGYTSPETGEVFTGERAIWERYQAERNIVQRTGDALLTDPLNVVPSLGAPARGVGGALIRQADELPGVAGTVTRGAGEVIEGAGRVADIPENLLGSAVNTAIRGGGAAGRAIGEVPVGGGRRVGDLFADEESTRIRNLEDEANVQLSDVVGQRPPGQSVPEPESGTHNFPNGMTATRTADDTYRLIDRDGEVVIEDASWDAIQNRARTAPETTAPTPPPEDVTPVQQGLGPTAPVTQPATAPTPLEAMRDRLMNRDEALQQPEAQRQLDLAVDRPIEDLGQAPDQAAIAGQPELAVDRPVEDLGDVDPFRLRSEQEFRASDVGRETEREVATWPEHLKPQTAAERAEGVNRVGADYDPRPVDMARALATERPDEWRAYMRDYGKALKRKNGYAIKEQARQLDKSWTSFDQKRLYEVMLEGTHYTKEMAPIFNRHFAEDAELPPYAWKRWGTGNEAHTALDTLQAGTFMREIPEHELAEIAMFHPDDGVATEALEALKRKEGLARLRSNGDPVTTKTGNVVYDTNIRPELRKGGDRNTGVFTWIQQNRDRYKELMANEANNATRFGDDRLSVDDVNSLSRQVNAVPGQETSPVGVPTEPPPAVSSAPVTEPIRGSELAPGDRVLVNGDTWVVDADRNLTQGVPGQGAMRNRNPRETYDRVVAGPDVDDLEGQRVFERDLARSLEEEAGSADQAGQGVFEQDLARTAFADVPAQAAAEPAPQALPFRATSAIEATPMGPPQPVRQVRRETTSPEAISAGVAETERAKAIVNIQQSRAADPLPPAEKATTTWLPEQELQSYYVRGRMPSRTQMETLGQKFENNENLLERWDRYTTERVSQMGTRLNLAEAEEFAKVRVLNDWVTENLDEKNRAFYQREYDRIRKAKPEEGAEPVSDISAQIQALDIVRTRGGRTRLGARYDNFMSGLKQVFLYNILTGSRYVQTQLLGNSVTLAITHYSPVVGRAFNPTTFKRAVEQAIRKGDEVPNLMQVGREEYGLGGERRLVTGGNEIRDETASSIDEQMKIKGIPILGRMSPFLANETIRTASSLGDTMPRQALWMHIMDTNMTVPRSTLRERMMATLPPDAAPSEVADLFDGLPQRFSSTNVREMFGHIDRKWADRHARDWQEALTKTDKVARAEVRRVFFDGGEKVIDRHLKRVVFFHYWMSRATPLYTEAIARDPLFLYQYANLIEEVREDDDLSGTDFVKWLETPFGYNTLIRPDAFFQALGSFMEDAGYRPDGENWLGWALRHSPVMTNPILDTLVNIAGMKGDYFPPDPLGTGKFVQFAQMAIDNANATFGWNLPPARNPSDDFFTWARARVSGALDFVPGIDQIPDADAMAYKENEVRSIVAEIALERGLDVDDPIVQLSMVDPSSEMYQEAMKRYSRQDALDIVLRILPVTAVLYPKSQLKSPKQRTADINAIKAANNGEYTPEAEAILAERDTIAAATESSRTLQVQEDEYRALGSPEARGAMSFYYSIRFGSQQNEVAIGGRWYTPGQLQSMDEDSRESLADQWAEETGNTGLVESLISERKVYRDNHPQYADYSQWGAQVRDYDGGPVKWWQDMIVGNPNAARWYESLPDDQKTNEIELTSTDAYIAYIGDQRAYWEPLPIETRDMENVPYNPIGGDDGGTGSSGSGEASESTAGPTKEKINEQIAAYNTDMAAYNQAASEMLGQSVDVNLINPQARSAVEANLRSIGIEKPYMGGYLYDYLTWAEAQGSGDASVAAYLRWYEQNNPEPEKVAS